MKNAGVYLDYTEDDLPRRASSLKSDDDAVLQMWGVGKEIWKEEDGTRSSPGSVRRWMAKWKADSISERIRIRIIAREGGEFRSGDGPHGPLHRILQLFRYQISLMPNCKERAS